MAQGEVDVLNISRFSKIVGVTQLNQLVWKWSTDN